MQFRNNDSRWGVVAQSFHWLIALLILAAWLTNQLHEAAPKHSPESAQWLNYHKSVGISVFLLIWFRLAWRLIGGVPKAIVVAPWQERLSQLVHLGLYLAMIGMPVTGILMTEYGGHPASWFGVFDLPALVTPNKDTGHTYHFLHTDVIWLGLLGLLGLHLAGALWHHFLLKDSVLKRMLPWGSR